MEELVKYLRALVFLQVQQLTVEKSFDKAEVLLVRAGFSYKEIAEFLGKTQAAVAKAVQRAS